MIFNIQDVEVKSKLCLYAYFPNNFGLAPWLRHAGDGSVVTWGNARVVGDSAKVQAKLAADVQFICSTNFAFAALKGDGSVVCWGIVHRFRSIYPQLVQRQLSHSPFSEYFSLFPQFSLLPVRKAFDSLNHCLDTFFRTFQHRNIF